jgi:hypothetical protein
MHCRSPGIGGFEHYFSKPKALSPKGMTEPSNSSKALFDAGDLSACHRVSFSSSDHAYALCAFGLLMRCGPTNFKVENRASGRRTKMTLPSAGLGESALVGHAGG